MTDSTYHWQCVACNASGDEPTGTPIPTHACITPEYEQLVWDVLVATAEASQQLILEAVAEGIYEGAETAPDRVAWMNRRRAELWHEHLTKAGLAIGRLR